VRGGGEKEKEGGRTPMPRCAQEADRLVCGLKKEKKKKVEAKKPIGNGFKD
jgi:hypothetical protein